MQQAAYQLTRLGATWYGNLLLALFAVSFFAAFSWHVVEKPALRLKRHIISKANANRTPDEMAAPDKTIAEVAEGGSDPTPDPTAAE